MEIKKEEFIAKEWVLKTNSGSVFPISVFGKMISTILLFVLVALAYNIGQHDAYQIVAIAGYLSDGIYDPATNSYTKCIPVLEGNKAIFDCTGNYTTYTWEKELR